MTRAVWIDSGAALDVGKLHQAGITAPYYAHTDPQVTAAQLDVVKSLGFAPGIYSAWNWYPNLDGPRYAEKLDSELRRIGWAGNAPVCVDIETHDVGYILAFFRRWRVLRPTRATAFTFEGFQGGLFSPTDVSTLVGCDLRFVPQLYRGDMTPHEHSPIIDLLIAGFPAGRIDGFYDAAALPYSWRGFAFTQARLP